MGRRGCSSDLVEVLLLLLLQPSSAPSVNSRSTHSPSMEQLPLNNCLVALWMDLGLTVSTCVIYWCVVIDRLIQFMKLVFTHISAIEINYTEAASERGKHRNSYKYVAEIIAPGNQIPKIFIERFLILCGWRDFRQPARSLCGSAQPSSNIFWFDWFTM